MIKKRRDPRFNHSVNNEIKLKILEPRFTEELYELSNRNRDYLREWLPWVDGTKSSNETKSFIEFTLKQLGEWLYLRNLLSG